MYKLIHGDCLDILPKLKSESIDLILADPPYATTNCKWDSIIPFEPLWEQLKRVIKSRSAVVLFGTQPFTSKLICSNIKMFKYNWVWDKKRVGGFVSAKLKPLKLFEDICVFSDGKTANCNKNNMVYYPQGLVRVDKISRSSTSTLENTYARPSQKKRYVQEYTNYPKQLLEFPLDKNQVHPTQKPVALLEYLIRTYSKEGCIVLDFCMGSGSTGVAALQSNRHFIGIEKDNKYFEIAKQRIESCIS